MRQGVEGMSFGILLVVVADLESGADLVFRFFSRLGLHQPVLSRPIVSLASDADRETMRQWYNEAAAQTNLPEASDDSLVKIERRHAATRKIPLVEPVSAEHDFLMRFHNAGNVTIQQGIARKLPVCIVQRVAIAVENADDRALCGKLPGDFEADAAGAAGDDYVFVLESKWHWLFLQFVVPLAMVQISSLNSIRTDSSTSSTCAMSSAECWIE